MALERPHRTESFRTPNVSLIYNSKVVYDTGVYAAGGGGAEADKPDIPSSDPAGGDPRGTFRLGLFSSSMVIPSSFVMPTTGGSPFLTNSYMPVTKTR